MPAFVQEAVARWDTATPASIAFASGVGAGHVVMLGLTIFDNFGATTVTPSGLGATWTRIYQSGSNSNGDHTEIWKGESTTAGGTSVSVAFTAPGNALTLNMAEFSGVNYIGVPTANGLVSTTSLTTPTVSLTTGDIAFGFFEWSDFATTYSVSSDSPGAWTSLTTQGNNNSSESTVGSYRVAAGAESASRAITLSGAVAAGLAISVDLRAAAPPQPKVRPVVAVRQAVARASVW